MRGPSKSGRVVTVINPDCKMVPPGSVCRVAPHKGIWWEVKSINGRRITPGMKYLREGIDFVPGEGTP